MSPRGPDNAPEGRRVSSRRAREGTRVRLDAISLVSHATLTMHHLEEQVR